MCQLLLNSQNKCLTMERLSISESLEAIRGDNSLYTRACLSAKMDLPDQVAPCYQDI
jgi:hypothetical protein